MSEQSITLDEENSVEILFQFIEIAQKSGSFLLPESQILKRCKDVLILKASDPEISVTQAKELFLQAIVKGQSRGVYSLDQSALLHNVCIFVNNSLQTQLKPKNIPVSQQNDMPRQQSLSPRVVPVSSPTPVPSPAPTPVQPQSPEPSPAPVHDDSMDSLSAPVPLRSRPRRV